MCGCVRAEYWGRLPMIRIGNVNLEPGTVPADKLFGRRQATASTWRATARGRSTTSGLNFQFGCQIGYEIKNGKKGKHAQEPDLRGHDADVLALVRRDR